jgi:apolipoprotein D and lipocalin family protein
VGYPGRGYGWVLARELITDQATYQLLLGLIATEGYDIGQFRRVPQRPDQMGQAGFP